MTSSNALRKLLVPAAALLGAGLLAANPAQAETIVGLTSTNALVLFDSAAPTLAGPAMTITGLTGAGESILGIDLRPSNGLLYGLGSLGNLYTLNAQTGAATFVSVLSTGLSGISFGVDFNPAADRLRVTSNAGQNLRINVNTGAATVDGALNGAVTNISASAYTNNDNNPATGTALFGINSVNDRLYSQNPPNAGTQVEIGALGVDTSAAAGFDISGATGIAFASLTNGDTAKSSFYTINLATGAASLTGAFGIGGNTVVAPALLDITVAAIPEPSTYAMLLAGLALLGTITKRRRNR